MHFIYFLGRFHVLAVHLPIALVLIVAALEWLTRKGRRPDLQPALGLAWGATAICAIGTVILGYMHFAEGGFHGPTVEAHRALGTSIAVVSLVGWIMRSQASIQFQKARPAIVVLLVALVVATGHFGGELTHGSGYLVQYAPNFIREMAGLAPIGPRATTLAAADPYTDVIAPVLEQRCMQCHSSSQQKGGLDMSTYASLMKGGGDGPVIVKGNAKASDLIRRVSLPQTDDDYMPKEHPPLSADQITLLTWWVNGGARTGVKVAALNPPPQIQSLIQDELNPAPGGGSAAELARQPNAARDKAIEEAARKLAQEAALAEEQPPKQADPKAIAQLQAAGFMARQVSLSDTDLVVSPALPGAGFSASNIQALSTIPSDQIIDLNLADAGLSDADIAPIARLTALTRLRLDDNKLTDRALPVLSSLPKLVEVNLVGNPGISDAGMQALAAIKSLRRVYLFQTGVTKAGTAKLHQLRPDLEIDAGDISVAPGGAPQNPDPPARQDPKSNS
ncbi:MAG TPA: c-type cytochrome domain-containing protein [Steroidobacteraceae bacterium]|nr:c-type cytochrome domain-containing protein [Steroidobacteraceae bacterium]